jgi:hypothetical protein
MIKSISEILKEVSEAKKEKKVELLRQNDSQPMRAILAHALDPSIKWMLPEGAPPYKPNEALDQHNRLYQEARKLYIFCDPNLSLPKVKREALFIELLESIDPEDAKLILAAKEKKIPYKGITSKLVQEAFPDLF